MLLLSSSWTSSIMAEKKKKMADLLRFFTYYVNNLNLWARKLEKFFTYPLQIGYAYY